MADARATISYRFDFSDMIRQLREAADLLEGLQQAEDPGATEATDGAVDTACEVLRQMQTDPRREAVDMAVQPYLDDRSRPRWVFRCWGTDDGCEGWVSLGHTAQSAAERARDRHVAGSHAQPGQPE